MANLYKTLDPKDPAEQLDYIFDWAGDSNNNGLSDWLSPEEVITAHEVTVSAGITLISSNTINAGTAVLVWISGGTEGSDYEIKCQIETATRIGVRTAVLPVRKR